MRAASPEGVGRTPGPSAARWLFGSAALFNLAIGAGLLVFTGALGAVLQLDPIAGTNRVLLNFTAGFIILFGWAYALIAADPVRYRPYVRLGAVGKLLAFAGAALPWMAGQVSWRVPALVSGDLIFAVLFVAWLRRTAQR